MRWSEEQYREYINTKQAPKEKMAKRPKVSKELAAALDQIEKIPKYRNKKTEYDGILFDSKKEAEFYRSLLEQKKAGYVIEILLQPKYLLQEKFRKNGKVFREIIYIADFEVTYEDGHKEIIDTKGMKTKDYRIKQKLFEYKYPELTIREY